jgi:hypothetical protein
MENNLQTTETKFYIDKKFEIRPVLNLTTKLFLEKTYEFKKLKELKTEPNFVFLITGWATHTSALMQIKNPIDNFIKQDIIEMLGGFWSNLSFEELVKAFEMERFGVFENKTEHFQLFDCNYISQILKKYQNWARTKKTELNISNKIEIQQPKITEQEKKQIMENAINNKYLEFLETNDISEPYAYIFKELVEIGIIKMATKETPKLSIYYDNKIKEAKEQLIKELEATKEPDKYRRKELKNILDAIVSNTENLDAKSKIENRAKKLVLIDFFNKKKELKFEKII